MRARNAIAAVVASAGAAAAGAAACGTGSDCGVTSLRVRDASGAAVAAFLAAFETADGATAVAECAPGGKVPDGVRCEAGRVVLPGRAAPVRATVKAPGYGTVHLAADTLAGCGETAADLVPLSAPEAGTAYRTGFDAAGGLEQYLALAYLQGDKVPIDELGPNHAVKFLIQDLDREPRIWFADTRKYPIHCDFARQVLKLPFASCDEYAQKTYRGKDRKQMAGTIYWRPDAAVTLDGTAVRGVFTVEFFPYDDLTPAMASLAMDMLGERMPFAPPWGGERRLAYVPAGAMQEAEARAAATNLAAGGVAWLPRSELFAGVTRQFLNPAVSYGTLRVMSPEDLDRSAVSYMDILLLTRLPNDLPLVGGTITEEIQTPLAHVNVAARARGTPNMTLVGASKDEGVAPLVGRVVRFEVTPTSFSLAESTAAEATKFWEDRLDRPPLVPGADLSRRDLPAFDDIGFADSASVGVKTANIAELHRLLPPKAPDGFAIPFAHYEDHVTGTVVPPASCDGAATGCGKAGHGQAVCDGVRALCLGPGGAAGESLSDLLSRLVDDPAFRTRTDLRFATLEAVRGLFCSLPLTPSFATMLDARVADRFGGTTVRLRSSSNAEDLEDFSGAGLYTSVSATAGTGKSPSKRICHVWGSAWNWVAFEERSFWNVDHRAVRMGVAVHPSFPDEAANGVLITQNVAQPGMPGMYANVQLGEASVTNPEDGSVPEEFTIIPAPDGTVQASRTRMSSLSPASPILTDAEVLALYLAADQVHGHFAKLYGKSPAAFAADIEFKFHGPERALFLKQVRPYRW